MRSISYIQGQLPGHIRGSEGAPGLPALGPGSGRNPSMGGGTKSGESDFNIIMFSLLVGVGS